MAATPYSVVLPAGGHQVLNGNNALIVIAGNTTDAKAAAQAFTDSDAAPWDQATVTALVEDPSLQNLRIDIGIVADMDNAFEDDFLLQYVVPQGASADTVDEIGALLVAALNATPELAGVTYTSGSDTVTIVETNNCGLSTITAIVYKLGGDGVWFRVTDLDLTVGAVGMDASSDRTIVITPISTGTSPVVVSGYQA